MRIEDVPECAPRPGEVKLKVHYCGICGTDLHEYLEGPMFIAKEPHPLTGYGAPVIIGHEFAGEIIALGGGRHRLVGGRPGGAGGVSHLP
ncbi:MAG: hypothetical protein KatS3mg052_1199 [Candidatus Roseilinea sp.]|nr:MAG: hypothetical protein KatS3mg052_1199 [Candidatus Roseilinea sp.]